MQLNNSKLSNKNNKYYKYTANKWTQHGKQICQINNANMNYII